jgi:hypothetical protein
VRGGRKLKQQFFEHTVQAAGDVVVPNPNHAIAQRDERLVALLIDGAVRVLTAVDFNDQPCFATEEVDKISADWCLPDEFKASQPAIPETMP